MPENIALNDASLSLRRFNKDDANILLKIATDEVVAKYVPWAKAVKDEESAQRMIDSFHTQWRQGAFARYLITDNDEPYGYIGIWRDKRPDTYEIGFVLLPQHRGRGIIGWVLSGVEKLLIENLNATQLIAHVAESNQSSQRALEKQGYVATDKFNEDGERRFDKSLSNE